MAKRLIQTLPDDESEVVGINATGEKYRKGGEGFCNWCEDHVRIPIYPEGEDIAVWYNIRDLPTEPDPITKRSYNTLWTEQKKVCIEALKMVNGRFIYRLLVFCWPRGEGKTERIGSKVLMYDGTIKTVENVVIGDILMGDDNTPRKVVSTHSGKEELYEVVPVRGESLFVTYGHVLSLKRRRRKRKNPKGGYYADYHAEEIINISVKDYEKKSQNFKNTHLLYSVPIDWFVQDVPIDPYFLGMWLSDGCVDKPSITTMDKETVDYIYTYAKQIGGIVSVYDKKGTPANQYNIIFGRNSKKNKLSTLLRENNLSNNKHIPQEYKINSREVRMQILAGILDGDGYKNRNSMQIAQKSKVLSDDIAFLARSLGFHVNIKKTTKKIKSTGFEGEYYVIGITGDCASIPLKVKRRKCNPRRSDWKDPLVTGIKEIKSAGVDEYYGFELDGNGRYVTGNFMVTHNSLLTILIQVWKFFNWPRQQIVLGANSKDQTKFVHYDLIKDVIVNSPNLLYTIGGNKNVQEREIRLKDSKNVITSVIKPISTASGIVSNVTGYTFSEMFDMRNPKFFTQLDGSIRNIPNALGIIDSTVSTKDHNLYHLYENYIKKKTKSLFFHYKYSDLGVMADYWNPFMTQDQLEDYSSKFLLAEFERYFLNKWSAGSSNVFTKNMIEEIGQLGVNNKIPAHQELVDINQNIISLDSTLQTAKEKGFPDGVIETLEKIDIEKEKIIPVSRLYTLEDNFQNIQFVPASILSNLGDIYKTDWAVIAGIDMADPLAIRKKANSILAVMAKGLPNSKIDINLMSLDSNELKEAKFIYFLIGFFVLDEFDPLNGIKNKLEQAILMYDGIDSICGERYGLWDLASWAEKADTPFEPIYPNYDRQRAAFNHLYTTLYQGLFKAPTIPFVGVKQEMDILREELEIFDHNPQAKWFGSPEKKEKFGRQDDSVYGVGWGMYGGRFLGPDEFRNLSDESTSMFGEMYQNKAVLGNY
jgi:hypothetical protein